MVVSCLHSTALGSVEARLMELGYTVLDFDGATATNRASFFRAVYSQPWMGDAVVALGAGWATENWDSFVDFAVQGLTDLTADKVAVIWESSDRMLHSDFETLLEAADAFEDIQSSLSQIGERDGVPAKRLLVLLIGNEEAYPTVPRALSNV